MLSIRKPLQEEIALYKTWYDEKHKQFIDQGLLPPFDKDIDKIIDRIWVIADGAEIQGFFLTDHTEEVEAASGLLIHNMILARDINIKDLAECFNAFLDHEYHGENIYIRIEDYLSNELELLSLMKSSSVYTSVTMLKSDFSDINPIPSKNDMIIRSFIKGEDEDAFANLFYDIFKDISTAFTLEKIKNWTYDWVDAPGFDPALYLIAENDSQKIGLAAIELDIHNRENGHLYEIGVLDSFRGQGMASLLFQECTGNALKKGMKRLSTRVRKSNQKAYGFFIKLGFSSCFEKHYLRIN